MAKIVEVQWEGKTYFVDLEKVDTRWGWSLGTGWGKHIQGFCGNASVDDEGVLVIRIPFGTENGLPNGSAIRQLMYISEGFEKEVTEPRVAGYTVKNVTEEGFDVGCKHITWAEVDAVLAMRPKEDDNG